MNIRSIIVGVKFGLLWTRARSQAALGENQRAMVTLAKAYSLIKVEMPSGVAPLEANLLAGMVAINTGNLEVGRRAATCARTQLAEQKHRFNSAEISYLNQFCDLLICLCDEPRRTEDLLRREAHNTQPVNVRKHLLKDFPMISVEMP
jgi:hypothetical protein